MRIDKFCLQNFQYEALLASGMLKLKIREKTTIYVGNTVETEKISQIINRLKKDVPEMTIIPVKTLSELFYHLSINSYYTDFVNIDFELLMNSSSDPFDIIRAVRVVSQANNRNIKIGIVVGETTPDTLLKSVLTFKEIDQIICRVGKVVTYEDAVKDTRDLVNGNFKVSEKVKVLINKTKITKKKKNNQDLTCRQHQIVRLIRTRGLSNKHIAKTLDISESAVKAQLTQIYRKFNIRTRAQLLAFNAV